MQYFFIVNLSPTDEESFLNHFNADLFKKIWPFPFNRVYCIQYYHCLAVKNLLQLVSRPLLYEHLLVPIMSAFRTDPQSFQNYLPAEIMHCSNLNNYLIPGYIYNIFCSFTGLGIPRVYQYLIILANTDLHSSFPCRVDPPDQSAPAAPACNVRRYSSYSWPVVSTPCILQVNKSVHRICMSPV